MKCIITPCRAIPSGIRRLALATASSGDGSNGQALQTGKTTAKNIFNQVLRPSQGNQNGTNGHEVKRARRLTGTGAQNDAILVEDEEATLHSPRARFTEGLSEDDAHKILKLLRVPQANL